MIKKLWWLTVPVVTIISGLWFGWDGLGWMLLFIPFMLIVEWILYKQGTISIFDLFNKKS
jgi:hypothetical protein